MLHLNQLVLPIAHVHHVSPTFKILITLRFFNICSNISSDRSFRFDNQINIFHLVNLRIIVIRSVCQSNGKILNTKHISLFKHIQQKFWLLSYFCRYYPEYSIKTTNFLCNMIVHINFWLSLDDKFGFKTSLFNKLLLHLVIWNAQLNKIWCLLFITFVHFNVVQCA